MNISESIKPALLGVVVGGAAVGILGFSWLGWVGETKAEQMASAEAEREVVAVLAPICVVQAKADPRFGITFARIMEGRTYERGNLLMETGWATMPGAEEPDRSVATACVEMLQAAS